MVYRDQILRLQICVVEVGGIMEMAYKAVSIRIDIENCTVGFIPRSLLGIAERDEMHDKIVKVIELYRKLQNKGSDFLGK